MKYTAALYWCIDHPVFYCGNAEFKTVRLEAKEPVIKLFYANLLY